MARTKRPAPSCCLSSDDDEEDTSSESEQEKAVEEPIINQNQCQDLPAPPATNMVEAAATESVKRSKKKRKEKRSRVDDGEKKPLFQRVWEDVDEIALLESAVQFKTTHMDPLEDFNSFYDFTKNRGLVRFKKHQLKEKYARLHKRYLNNVKKDNNNNFQQSPHDQAIYDLSKQIWPMEAKAGEEKKLKSFVLNKNIALAGIEEIIFSNNLDKETAQVLEERWRKLRTAELELFLQRNQLVGDQVKMTLDALKSV